MIFTEEHDELYAIAKGEPPFPAEELLQELSPLLEDYFIAAIKTETNAIEMIFPNGQKFRLTAEETA